MNAGAYGGEMKDILQKVTVLTPDGTVQTLLWKNWNCPIVTVSSRRKDIW